MNFPTRMNVVSIKGFLWRNVSGVFTVNPDGYLLQYLAQRLNFRYRIKEKPHYSSFYKLLAIQNADMGIASQGVGTSNTLLADFTVPYYHYDVGFMTEEPADLPKYGAFWYPFSSDVWIGCVVVALVATLMCKWITASKTSLANTFLSVLGSMLRQPLNMDVASLEKAIWWSTWLVWTTVMSTAYGGLFFSFLAAPGKERGVKNFLELSAAVQRKEFTCQINKINIKSYLLDSNEEHLRILGQTIGENNWYYDDYDKEPEVGKTQAVIGNREYLQTIELFPPNRVKVFSEDSLRVLPIVICVKNNFCCLEQLNLALGDIVASGLAKRLFDMYYYQEKWRAKLRRWEWPDPKQTVSALTMEDLKHVFFFLLIGHSVAFVVFLCERFIPKHVVDVMRLRFHRFSKRHWKFKKRTERFRAGR